MIWYSQDSVQEAGRNLAVRESMLDFEMHVKTSIRCSQKTAEDCPSQQQQHSKRHASLSSESSFPPILCHDDNLHTPTVRPGHRSHND
jgi:hypothetical protein